MLSWILKMAAGPLIDKVMGGVKTVFGDKEKRDDQAANYDAKVMDQFAAESMQVRENRTWFDSLVNGLNRLPRPFAFFLTIWIFIWPIWDMLSFQLAMTAYEGIPEWLAILITVVWTFYFGQRFISKDLKGFKARSTKEVQDMIAKQEAIRKAIGPNEVPGTSTSPLASGAYVQPEARRQSIDSVRQLTADQYNEELEGSRPLSLPAIVEWNRRHNPNF